MTVRHPLRALARKVAQRLGSTRGRGQRGAVAVEFAIIAPLLMVLTFGIVEFSSAYHDSSIAADAARAGGRVASAEPRNPSYAINAANAVSSALKTLPKDAPQEMWVYKANGAGYPGSGSSFSSCGSNCIKYLWNSSAQQFDTSNAGGGGWPASAQQVCTEPFDQVGVFVKIDHKFVTKLFGAQVTLTDHSVFRFEPTSTSACS